MVLEEEMVPLPVTLKKKQTHQQDMQHNRTRELTRRGEAGQRLGRDWGGIGWDLCKQLQTPSHSLLTEARSQGTSQHFGWGIPFLHNCAYTPNTATSELPSKDMLSSQSVQTLTLTTANKKISISLFFQKLKNVGRGISTAIELVTMTDTSRIPDFLACVSILQSPLTYRHYGYFTSCSLTFLQS